MAAHQETTGGSEGLQRDSHLHAIVHDTVIIRLRALFKQLFFVIAHGCICLSWFYFHRQDDPLT